MTGAPVSTGQDDAAPVGPEQADEAWCQMHATQLRSIELPAELHAVLAAKLRGGVFDAGESVSFGWSDTAGWSVIATKDMAAGSNLWLADHVWLFPNALAARQQIATVPELRLRLEALIGAEGSHTAQSETEPNDPAVVLDPESVDDLLLQVAKLAHPIAFSSGASKADSGDTNGADDALEMASMYYVDDEIGSRIRFVPVDPMGSATPHNVRSAAVFDHFSGQTFSVICEGCYFLVFVQLFETFNREKYGTNRESVTL
eukprot:SAG31_NODE_926_length_10930_cov_135.691626_13_plen_259_part_00